MFGLLKPFFGTQQDRALKRYRKIVLRVNEIEETLHHLTEDELRAKTLEFKQRVAEGESLDNLLPEAYAVVKNACRRLVGQEFEISGYSQKWDMVPYDVQILGACAMHHGAIAEMQTGEGKTLTATMPLYLNALSGKPVHLVTVNDYLAKRDCDWIGAVFRFLGLRAEALTNDVHPSERKGVYNADIVYGTASEFGFDYLRDNSMAQSAEEQVQRGYFFAIIDEVDSILIDEARTPLIISGPATQSRQMYDVLQDDVAKLVQKQFDLCDQLANEAYDALKSLGRIKEVDDATPLPKLPKKEQELENKAYHKLWLVGKGTPHNKLFRRLRENPDMRAAIERWDTFYYGDANKEDRAKALAELYIIIDERQSEYELTDKGIEEWKVLCKSTDVDEFTMMDLGHEYGEIDNNPDLDEQTKLQMKVEVREEDSLRKERSHNLRQLLRAHLLMEKDVEYIVQEGKIVIIDENTGRPQPGRRFSDGLHSAIEAKEKVTIQGETQTYATITLQNYFRMYEKLAGMTGTALTEANELKEIYKIDVLAIPTYRPCQRKDYDDEIYMTEREKYNAILKDIETVHATGQPILIGTESVEVSEKISRILKQKNLKHTVLNAKHHGDEAGVIADAGRRGAITVSTNMAGRGTDIKLKGGSQEVGGLYVIGTTRHQSRRIDRQLRGRSARLGDPGSSRFYVSFEDTLMRLFTSPRITAILQRFRPPEGEAIKAKVLNRSIETAQKRVEQRNYMVRKHTLEYDDVMNMQRKEIYTFRNELLQSTDLLETTRSLMRMICEEKVTEYFIERGNISTWNPHGYTAWLMTHFPVTFEEGIFDDDYSTAEEIEEKSIEILTDVLMRKLNHQMERISSIREEMGAPVEDGGLGALNGVLRNVMLRSVDRLWQEHLLRIDHLRSEVSLRTIGQKDPLVEFKNEAFSFFNELSFNIKLEIAHALFKFEIMPPPEQTKEIFKSKAHDALEKAMRGPSLALLPDLLGDEDAT